MKVSKIEDTEDGGGVQTRRYERFPQIWTYKINVTSFASSFDPSTKNSSLAIPLLYRSLLSIPVFLA